MEKTHKATEASTLEQYQYSEAFFERYLQAIHQKNAEIARTENQKGIKLVDGVEMYLDGYEYFVNNKKTIEDEFLKELKELIGIKKAICFCKTIAINWFDGSKKRGSGDVLRLKKSIANYLKSKTGKTDLSGYVQNPLLPNIDVFFSPDDIDKILRLNDQFLHKYLHEWKKRHPNAEHISRNEIYYRRGIACDTLPKNNDYFVEWDYINSYSLAFSVPEQFAQTNENNNKKYLCIINGICDSFNVRVLFFSPFIQGMDVGQLEVGVIPTLKLPKLRHQGNHSGIHEYMLE